MSSWKLLIAGSILSLTLVNDAAAESVYVNGQLALLKPSGFNSGYAAVVTTGLPIPERKNLFLEAELTVTLTAPEQDSRKLTYTGIGGYGVFQRLINEKLAIHGKAGMLYQYGEYDRGTNDSESGAGIAFVIGATYHRSRETSYLFELSSVQGTLDLNVLSAGIRYRFR